jgi:hypothetical protein
LDAAADESPDAQPVDTLPRSRDGAVGLRPVCKATTCTSFAARRTSRARKATVQPDGWHFEFTFNTADSAETNLFFLSNFLHDFFYDLGFDDAAATFQEDNFGRGCGVGRRRPCRRRQASGRNNAHVRAESRRTALDS